MRVSYNWLKRYVDVKEDAAELARRLTFAGLELDEMDSRGDGLSRVVLAQVRTCAPVPGSDHLHALTVEIGDEQPISVVCGAPNVAEGQLVACALPGAVLPGDFKIAARKTFGIQSEGMICSQKELGLSDDHSGIWVLDALFPGQEPQLGQELAPLLQLHDDVMIIELTPNRSDCLGMINIAREAAALTGAQLTLPDLSYPELGEPASQAISLTVEDTALCPRYVARIVRNVKIGPSPLWMQNHLLAAGMRPINNVVDISNYVMLEMDQPLHTFDYQKLRGQQILVRASRPGETMTTLDGKEHTFSGDEILICDGAGPVCVAGVMGGLETEVTDDTTDILIEAACFDPAHIRRTARRLGIPSEASQRFEKGVDKVACDDAARRAAQLLVQYCGGVADQGCVDARMPLDRKQGFLLTTVTLRPARVNAVLGTAYSPEQVKSVMSRLGFQFQEQQDSLLVTVPSYRQDISREEDLIEEVARILGYDQIPATIPMNQSAGGRSPRQQARLRLEQLAAGLGLNQTVNYSFISPKEADKLQLPADHDWRRVLPVSNPLSEDQSVMRRTLLPGLLNAALRNQSRRNLDLRLFELGHVFVPAAEAPSENQPQEIDTLGLLLLGASPAAWLTPAAEYDFYTLKGLVEAIAAGFGLTLSFQPETRPFLHPGRCAGLWLDGKEIGVIGEVHPAVAEAYGLSGRPQFAELEISPLINAALALGNISHDLPRYPASGRDIAVIGAAAIPASAVTAAIREAGGAYLREVRLFDLYSGVPILPGQRSLAYSLSFRSEEGTLTDAQVDQAFSAIVETLRARFGYVLR